MTIKISDALKEALKEAGRVIVLAIIPVLADSLGKGEVDLQVVLITGAIALLRFIDKYLHLQEKDGVAGGLVRF